MARKSAARRLSETVDLIAKYEEAGMKNTKNYRFAQDMRRRLQRGRGLYPKQRNWLDNIIETGVPEAQNTEKVEELLAATKVVGMTEFDEKVLNDFATKFRNGWSLSEAQMAFMNKLLGKANKLRKSGPYSPDEATIKNLRTIVLLAKGRGSYYFMHRPGECKAVETIASWLQWLDSGKMTRRPELDEWCVKKASKGFAGKLRKIHTPRFKEGAITYLRDGRFGVITSPPKAATSGDVVYDVLINGELLAVNDELLFTRVVKK